MDAEIYKQMGVITALAIAVGWSKRELTSEEKKTAKKKAAHAVLDGGLGLAAGSILLLYPQAPFLALVGVAMALVIVGKDVARKHLDKYLDK